jgi:heme exporter protein D
MNKGLILFNIIFYAITLTLYYQGKQDPSSSLEYAFFIIGFWVVALVTLLILLAKKILQPKTILDKIGIVTATPILCLIAVQLFIALK